MRLAVKFKKGVPVRFVSHLDVQRLFHRAFRRAKLPLAYSQGFNPHPLVSFAAALSVGMTSDGEYLDVILTEGMTPEEFRSRLDPVLPEGVEIVSVMDLGESKKSLTSAMRTASYTANVLFDADVSQEAVSSAITGLLSGEIVVMKKTKGGIKPTDIRPMVIELDLVSLAERNAVFKLKGVLSAEGGLNPDMLLAELYKKLGVSGASEVNRDEIEMDIDSLLA
ncbi:MAG: TIGR03936 family radical SAM-associated protein [Clostridiales bacterium]|nr:TIGR03936 family radical SAM-associated protein [Clostridiales bacterium]